MSQPIISVEGLGKRYFLSHRKRQDTLRDSLTQTVRGFFNRGSSAASAGAEEFWALRDVSFQVNQGDVIGIIGRNGAGKSTLLKILSRITEPTTGRAVIRGRVASLLEVGTGFHPELSGRENIYLNGAILGMSRAEITRKFDEIVAFAEVERFLDTQVKHYSSGMYVRLAFAVAAHLEPEILIVDEVLAVGDAQFQKKCLGKMRSIAGQDGRTVLFVSHNMAAISSLTSRAMLLAGGKLAQFTETADTVKAYYAGQQTSTNQSGIPGRGLHTRILAAHLLDAGGEARTSYHPGDTLHIAVDFHTDGSPGLSLELILLDPNEQRIGIFSLCQFHGESLPLQAGTYRYEIPLQGLWLAAGTYLFEVITSVANVAWDHRAERALQFDVNYSSPQGRSWDFRFEMGFGPIALQSSSAPRIQPIADYRPDPSP